MPERRITTPIYPLSKELIALHDGTMFYSLAIRKSVSEKAKRLWDSPLSFTALLTLQSRSLLIHRGIRSLCEAGWTPLTAILIRTMVDILVSCYAIAADRADADYMGFKFLGSFIINTLKDSETPDCEKASYKEALEELMSRLNAKDKERALAFVEKYNPQNYWYTPEYRSPNEILNAKSPQLQSLYRWLSSSVHGGFLGLGLFSDIPGDVGDIQPARNPLRTPAAIIASSRFVLEVDHVIDLFAGLQKDSIYKRIMEDKLLPLARKHMTDAPGAN